MTKTEDKQLPLTYLKLARNLSSLGEDDLAQQVCDRGLVRFPKNTNLHCLRGGILVNLFNKTKRQELLSEALLSYEKSLSLNPGNYLSALTAAKIYIKSSALKKAKEKLDLIFSHSPGDAKATQLLNFIKAKAKTHKQAKDKKSQSLTETVEIDERETSDSVNYDMLISHLRLFKRLKGLKMVLLIDVYGVVLKCANRSDMDANQFGLVISNIFRSSQDVIHHTTLGAFRVGVLVSPAGYIYIVAAESAILVIVSQENADHKDIENQIQIYLQEISS